ISPRALAGNKKSVYQETGSKRPMYIANAINGLPALQFDGSTQYLYSQNNNTTPSAPPLVAGDDSYTMIAVFSPSKVTSANSILDQTPNNPSNGTTVTMKVYDESMKMSGYNDTYDVTASTLLAKSGGNYIGIISLEDPSILSANNISFYLNNNSYKQTFSPSGYSIGDDKFLLASYLNGIDSFSQFFSGYIGEVLVFDRALKTEEIDTINKYLSKKWGIALK
ncbi:MAG: hypothetical protein EBT55_05690, partial [Proteobacteria bacterium]|nr:hypothetical protein [Pseudomonadota bacterium]